MIGTTFCRICFNPNVASVLLSIIAILGLPVASMFAKVRKNASKLAFFN